MIKALISAKDTSYRFNERAFEIAICVERYQASSFENYGRNDRIYGVSANVLIRIAGVISALKFESRLNNSLLTDLPLILQLLADLNDLTTKLVPDDNRLLCNVRRNALMGSSLLYATSSLFFSLFFSFEKINKFDSTFAVFRRKNTHFCIFIRQLTVFRQPGATFSNYTAPHSTTKTSCNTDKYPLKAYLLDIV